MVPARSKSNNQQQSVPAHSYRRYYISGAPQCPFPDAYMGSVLNAVAFDMVFVQFCEQLTDR